MAAWVCHLPLAVARWLTSPRGAPRSPCGKLLPGCIGHLGDGEVRLDATAVDSLRQCGALSRVDGADVLVIGGHRYPVVPDC